MKKIRTSEPLKQDHTRSWRLKAKFIKKKNNDNKDKTNYSIIIL